MTSEQLAALAGIVLSLLFSYVPGFTNWYNPLDENRKRLVMIGLLLLVAVGAMLVSCSNLFEVGVACSTEGAVGLAKAFIVALIANQSVYALSPRKA